MKPGLFRRATATVVLGVVNFGTRHLFNRGSLTGVKTIHFARWVFLDGKRRIIFASNYDGSLESYMGDFIDKVAWGLNAVFSNGVGYPRTSWLVAGGAQGRGVVQGLPAIPPDPHQGVVLGLPPPHDGEHREQRGDQGRAARREGRRRGRAVARPAVRPP